MKPGRDPNVARNKILITGFRLYTEKTIESVSYQMIAEEAGVGPATVVRHFPRKQDLVIAIATWMWQGVWAHIEGIRPETTLPEFSAFQRMEFFMDRLILLYQTQPEVLKFSVSFDTYVQQENLSDEQLTDYHRAVSPLQSRFHLFYLQAQRDHSVRTDIDEDTLFHVTLYTMLSVAGRYACGITWPKTSKDEALQNLKIVKDMVLTYCKGGNAE